MRFLSIGWIFARLFQTDQIEINQTDQTYQIKIRANS